MTSLVAMYQKGAITADHLVAECLHRLDPGDPGPVLDPLPDEILDRMLDFAVRYRPDRTVTNYGLLPTPDQVDAARRWIEDRQDPTRQTRVPEPSDWDRYQMEARILQILASAPTHPGHETGRFFMTPYQIAIEFARRYKDDF
jgi:hypothetical protein